MPNRWQNKQCFGALLAVSLAIGALAGCATKATSAGDTATSDGSEPAPSANSKDGTTASNRYIDPALVSSASVADDTSAPDAYGVPAQEAPDLAGAVSQPTGIRAGSVSIFSAPAPVVGEAVMTGTVPGSAAPGRVNATAGSVFSAPAPAPVYGDPACGTAADGTPVSC
jgi:hypothetical protein